VNLLSFIQIYNKLIDANKKQLTLELVIHKDTSQTHDNSTNQVVQVSNQGLIFNNRQCNVLIFNDVTNVKRLAKVEFESMRM
jgi:hypothetical protein